MKLKINGKEAELEAKTISGLLQAKEVEPHMVAVELNEKMIEREEYDKTPINEGDRVELHYFMGGGAL